MAAVAAVAVGILSVIKKSSPYLRGILSLFGRAFSMFFRPFGDFLASLLRPLAVILLKFASKWLTFTRSELGEEGLSTNLPSAEKGLTGGILPTVGISGGFNRMIGDLFKSIDFSKLKDFGLWVWEKLKMIWSWEWKLELWLIEKIKSIWNWSWDFNLWLVERIKTIWNWSWDFGGWLWDTLTSAFGNLIDIFSGFGSWLWTTITDVFSNIGSIFSNFGTWLWDTITGWFGKGDNNTTGYATGTPFVPGDGMYKLHRGEQVIPRGQNNSSVVLKPTFQITGSINQDIDMDAIVRRASRVTEMELKKRGIL